ncbi:MAG: thioredoxin family protein [Candidatus Thorarchaeota archaeon]|jgi:thioredoxin-like negative regulator of GroEL
MILFFTTENCTWCDVVKNMVDEESVDIGGAPSLYEVNIEEHRRIAEAFGVMMVPTLVSGRNTISGIPSTTDLRSFLLQSASRKLSRSNEKIARKYISSVRLPNEFNNIN